MATQEPVHAEEDKRRYRLVTLHNQLQCLLIQDDQTESAAAAMDVRVGHFSDPDQVPGLAHLLGGDITLTNTLIL